MSLTVVVASTMLSLAGKATPKSWTPNEHPLSPNVCDSNPNTYEVFRTGLDNDPVDFGLEWVKPQRVGEARFGFASLGGRVYEPSPASAHLEAKVGKVWRTIPADITLDYSGQGSVAPAQGRGTVWWKYRFSPVQAEAIRMCAATSAHDDPGYQCIVLAEMLAGPGGTSVTPGPPRIIGQSPQTPSWLAPEADLSQPSSGARISRGATTEIRWPRQLLMNCVKVPSYRTGIKIEFLAGRDWRAVTLLPSGERASFRFIPISTAGLRIHTSEPFTVHFDEAGRRYFEQVKTGRTDVLGDRLRSSGAVDLAGMQSLLLPINFSKAAIGRPGNHHETIALWTGTFLMVEKSIGVDPQTGKRLPTQDIDRWFAPIASKGRFGADWMQTRCRYLDGWMPAVVTDYEEDFLSYSQTVFVTPPGRSAYGNVAIVDIKNTTSRPRKGRFEYAMGRRPLYGEPWTPFSQDPLPTEYTVDADKRTVRNLQGEVVFQALTPGKWGGTPRENRMSYEFTLKPGESKRLSFFMPSVDDPHTRGPKLDPEVELSAFKTWWKRQFNGAAQIDVPESPINDLYKNLIAQSLIITLDGTAVRYGAYQYECYFGVEEGWPAVALAQFGFADTAKRISELMLLPALMDKTNYHHQYRNGLDPWYAMTIARLTGDTEWLGRQMPMIKACADWTMKVTEGNKDPKYGGTLPKHIYGGDIGMPAYSFYSNATCWRGLHDTADALDLMSKASTQEATKYRDAAATYRSRIYQLADQLVDPNNGLPFLSMSFDLDTPSGHREKEPVYGFLGTHTSSSDTWRYVGNYWNLFAPLLLEVHLFDVDDKRATWVPKYIEHRGGLLTGLARFDDGLDHIYGKGYIESLLQQGRRGEFVTSMYGLFANGMSQDLFSSPEVSGVFPLRTDNLSMYREHERMRWNWFPRFVGPWMGGWQNQEGEPLSAGAGMALQILRMALVREDDRADPPVGLKLLDGAPPHWFKKGQHVEATDMRTFFGKVSLRVESLGNRYSAHLKLPNVPCEIHFPHPDGLILTSVTVNGKPWMGFSRNDVVLQNHSPKVSIEATFGRP